MELVLRLVLICHIAFGFTSLGSGLVSIILRKGGTGHKRSGLLFFYGMLGVVITAFVISISKSDEFLFHIAVFTLFLVYSGYRSNQNRSLLPSILDWIILILGLANGIAMVISQDVILMVFGGLSLFLGLRDVSYFYRAKAGKQLHKMTWLVRHVGMMLGGYLAALTAFIVTNVTYSGDFAWVPWLLPTILIVPLIFYWVYRVRSGKLELIDLKK
ncbi:MAG: hypothetical protein AAFQ02_06680 [Bacteroidota bacterium]